MIEPIFHLADRGTWEARDDMYWPPGLDDEGFIHCSTHRQLAETARSRFRDHTVLVLLTIDPDLADANVVFENLDHFGEDYPHVYGPIPTSAVISATPYLSHLEEGMWRETRADREWIDHVLHPDFVEIGRSGRLYGRQEAIDATDYPYEFELPLGELEVDFIRADVALLTYISGAQLPAHRTSLWVRTDRGWRLRFHQGTPLRMSSSETLE